MIEIAGLTLHLYGLTIGVGILFATIVVEKIAQRENQSTKVIWDALVWVIIAGIIGARAYHVIDESGYYQQHAGEIIRVWQGGLGIFGAIIGGGLGLVGYVMKTYPHNRIHKLSLLLDLSAFGLPIGQAIGRWGNYFNQELYGKPSNLPWSIAIEHQFRSKGWENFTHFHPLFLYESLLNLCLFMVIFGCYRIISKTRGISMLGTGGYFGMYLVGYGLIRLLLEPLRIESWVSWGIPTAQIFSTIAIFLGGIMLIRLKKIC